jgi:hypothetical protein
MKGQVKVMSDSPEGLKKGLDVAEEVLEKEPTLENAMSEAMEESSPEREAADLGLSPEDIDAKIAELLKLKTEMQQQ